MARSWQRSSFTDHPGLPEGDPDAFFGAGTIFDKVKVWCTKCYHNRVADTTDATIIRGLWSNPLEGWIPSRIDKLTTHLRDCIHQPIHVRNRARAVHNASLQRRREREKRRRAKRRLAAASGPSAAAVPVQDQFVNDMEPGPEIALPVDLVETGNPFEVPFTGIASMGVLAAPLVPLGIQSAGPSSQLSISIGETSNVSFNDDSVALPVSDQPIASTSATTLDAPCPEFSADLLSDFALLDGATLAMIEEVLGYSVFDSQLS